jgi:hypothetical protein
MWHNAGIQARGLVNPLELLKKIFHIHILVSLAFAIAEASGLAKYVVTL